MCGQCMQDVRAQKMLCSRALLPHRLRPSPTIFLTAPLSYDARVFHRGQCAKLQPA
jgi:hypothetical protein